MRDEKYKKLTILGALLEDEMLKSSQRCRTKHVSKSKCTKYFSLGAHLEVEMLKKCTALWREEHFEVKMVKTLHCRTAFGS
jgi:hypothetical protein